jgi:thioredoxin 1
LEEVSEEYAGKVNFFNVDVDENPDIAVRYKVMSIPTMIIFRNGEVFSKEVGASSKKEVEKAIGRAL